MSWRTRLGALLRLVVIADRRRAVTAVVLSALVGFSATAMGLLFKLLADGVVAGDKTAAVVAAVLLAVIGTFQSAGGRYVLLLTSDIHDAVSLVVNREVMRLAGETPGLEHHEIPEYLDRMALLRDEVRLLADALRQGVGALVLVIRVVSTAVVLATVHPVLLLLPAFTLPSLWTGLRSRRVLQKAREDTAADGRLLDHLLLTVSSIPGGAESRIFGLGEELTARSRRLWDRSTEVVALAQLRAAFLDAAGWAIFAVGDAAAIAWTVLRAIDGAATPGDVLLVVILAAQVNGQIAQSLWILGGALDATRSVERWLWLQDYAAAAKAARRGDAPVPHPLAHGITFEGVGFRYPGTDTDVLQGVDVHLPAGATVAIVGENGAGKTTLVKLLCRFYEPTEGRITVDGVDVRDIDVEDWRRHLAADFQDFARLEVRLRESVGVGDLARIDDAPSVAAALARTDGAEIPAQLPDGLEAELGKQWGGAELSAGQWQKVAVARALMRDAPTVLLLDEPSSGLDPRAEHELLERYAEAAREVARLTGAVTVLVSHRFSTVRRADLIVVLDGGRIVACGTHDELMAAGGLYADLYAIQARAYA
ncbi:MAG: ABC transporter ATP-binding protein [Acidimicrobiales bacterium]